MTEIFDFRQQYHLGNFFVVSGDPQVLRSSRLVDLAEILSILKFFKM